MYMESYSYQREEYYVFVMRYTSGMKESMCVCDYTADREGKEKLSYMVAPHRIAEH